MAYLGKTPSQAVRSRYYYTATGGETSLSGADDNSNVLTFTDGNYVDVSLNGVALVAGTDYNTTTTNTIGGLTALVASDVVEVIVYDTFSVFGGNMAADLNFKDNVKANFGTGNDLQIFHDGSNSIIRDTGTGSLKFQYGTSDGVVFDSSGNVGIGTTSPVTRLQIKTQTNGNAAFQNSTSVTGGVKINAFNDAANASVPFEIDGSSLQFNISSVEKMRINSGGSVGIGTTSPTSQLSFGANIGRDFAVYEGAGGANKYGIGMSGDGSGGDPFRTKIYANGSEHISITSAGNVGIGTSSPSANTEIRGSASNGQLRLGGSTTATYANIYSDNDGVLILGADAGNNAANSYFGIEVDGTERWRINTAGHMVPANTNNGIILGSTASVASNLLNDYEEGTWTGTLIGTTTAGNSPTATGYYTKIGNKVTVWIQFNNADITGAVGLIRLNGLPFTVTSAVTPLGVLTNTRGPNAQASAYFQGSTDGVYQVDYAGSAISWVSTGGTYFFMTGTYRT